jgi:hypothetical protein
MPEDSSTPQRPRRRIGCNADVCNETVRKEGPDVWQFRWSETGLHGKRLYHKKIVGTVEQYPDEDAARFSVVGLVSELNTVERISISGSRLFSSQKPAT